MLGSMFAKKMKCICKKLCNQNYVIKVEVHTNRNKMLLGKIPLCLIKVQYNAVHRHLDNIR